MVTQNILRTHDGKKVFSDKKIRFVNTLDLIKCLTQIQSQRNTLYTRTNHELPSSIDTMAQMKRKEGSTIINYDTTRLFSVLKFLFLRGDFQFVKQKKLLEIKIILGNVNE